MARRQADPVLERTWRRHLEQRREGGLTIRAYCRRHGLAESSYHFWRRTISERDRQRLKARTPAFVPVAITATSTAASAIDVRLNSGTRIRVRPGCDRQLLADVLAAVEGGSC